MQFCILSLSSKGPAVLICSFSYKRSQISLWFLEWHFCINQGGMYFLHCERELGITKCPGNDGQKVSDVKSRFT